MRKADPERTIRYPLSWPAWLQEKVAEAANARAMSMATWLREAALEKLERTSKEQPMSNTEDITIEDAIKELSTPIGNPERDAIRLSFAQNMQLGHMQPAGRGEDGEITVRLTPAGKRFVEEMGKR